MQTIEIRCECCGTLIGKYLLPCAEYPNGGFEHRGRHRGEKHETIFTIPARESSIVSHASRSIAGVAGGMHV